MNGVLNLDYLRNDELASHLGLRAGHVLGVVGFGLSAETLSTATLSLLHVPVPVLGDESSYEAWSSSRPVSKCSQGNIQATADGEVVFGSMCLAQPQGMGLQAVARQAYVELFDFMAKTGYGNLLRTWNYLPRINEPELGLERYRCFNVGRHEAYVSAGRSIQDESIPAASVVGCHGDHVVMYFIASRVSGEPVDNPRQVAAYKYPERYGPRSPIFVRAMKFVSDGRPCLFVSGTASIVGHETVHVGDTIQQVRETLANIHVLLKEAGMNEVLTHSGGEMRLKVYVRYPQDVPLIREILEVAFPASVQAVYVQSDICRADLLLEIEGVCFDSVRDRSAGAVS